MRHLPIRTMPRSTTATSEHIEQPSEFQIAVRRFLDYLRVERNASEYTSKSYREDLTDVEIYFIEQQGVAPPADCVTTLDLRGYCRACTRVALLTRQSHVDWHRCGASSNSANAKAGLTATRPSPCGTREATQTAALPRHSATRSIADSAQR